jgi:malate synthase
LNGAAAAAIRADKEWEAQQGFLRAWVAHIFHMAPAAAPFKERHVAGWTPAPEMMDPDRYPIRIEVPEGPITVEGTRRNARMLLEYLEGWLRGRGAKGIDSLAGKPGIHPALMEDLATARISVAQIAQRVRHKVRAGDTDQVHDFALAKQLLEEELVSILQQSAVGGAADPDLEERYRKALKVAYRWVRNYTDLNFRSLGSYTRAELEGMAAAPDAF